MTDTTNNTNIFSESSFKKLMGLMQQSIDTSGNISIINLSGRVQTVMEGSGFTIQNDQTEIQIGDNHITSGQLISFCEKLVEKPNKNQELGDYSFDSSEYDESLNLEDHSSEIFNFLKDLDSSTFSAIFKSENKDATGNEDITESKDIAAEILNKYIQDNNSDDGDIGSTLAKTYNKLHKIEIKEEEFRDFFSKGTARNNFSILNNGNKTGYLSKASLKVFIELADEIKNSLEKWRKEIQSRPSGVELWSEGEVLYDILSKISVNEIYDEKANNDGEYLSKKEYIECLKEFFKDLSISNISTIIRGIDFNELFDKKVTGSKELIKQKIKVIHKLVNSKLCNLNDIPYTLHFLNLAALEQKELDFISNPEDFLKFLIKDDNLHRYYETAIKMSTVLNNINEGKKQKILETFIDLKEKYNNNNTLFDYSVSEKSVFELFQKSQENDCEDVKNFVENFIDGIGEKLSKTDNKDLDEFNAVISSSLLQEIAKSNFSDDKQKIKDIIRSKENEFNEVFNFLYNICNGLRDENDDENNNESDVYLRNRVIGIFNLDNIDASTFSNLHKLSQIGGMENALVGQLKKLYEETEATSEVNTTPNNDSNINDPVLWFIAASPYLYKQLIKIKNGDNAAEAVKKIFDDTKNNFNSIAEEVNLGQYPDIVCYLLQNEEKYKIFKKYKDQFNAESLNFAAYIDDSDSGNYYLYFLHNSDNVVKFEKFLENMKKKEEEKKQNELNFKDLFKSIEQGVGSEAGNAGSPRTAGTSGTPANCQLSLKQQEEINKIKKAYNDFANLFNNNKNMGTETDTAKETLLRQCYKFIGRDGNEKQAPNVVVDAIKSIVNIKSTMNGEFIDSSDNKKNIDLKVLSDMEVHSRDQLFEEICNNAFTKNKLVPDQEINENAETDGGVMAADKVKKFTSDQIKEAQMLYAKNEISNKKDACSEGDENRDDVLLFEYSKTVFSQDGNTKTLVLRKNKFLGEDFQLEFSNIPLDQPYEPLIVKMRADLPALIEELAKSEPQKFSIRRISDGECIGPNVDTSGNLAYDLKNLSQVQKGSLKKFNEKVNEIYSEREHTM